MKYTLILTYLLSIQITVYGQIDAEKAQNLEPLDWKTTECGRTVSGPSEKCNLNIINQTDRSYQGYKITWHGELRKLGFAKVNANSTKKLEFRSNDVWVFADSLLNAIGSFKLQEGENQIVIDSLMASKARKLNRQITDQELPGTISGGTILKEQESYDVLKYNLELEILPDQQYIRGANTITAKAVADLSHFVFDLDTLLTIKKVSLEQVNKSKELPFILKNGKYWSALPTKISENQEFNIRIDYEGNPRKSTHAPYKGGFSWNTTNNCEHWIATSCQVDGADLWFPCKDYQWDEANAVDLSFTVPSGLSAISNGVLVDSIRNQNGTTTFKWKVTSPINNYGIALNIAPYKYISDDYTCINGDKLDLGYWVLPENLERAKVFYPYSKKYLQFLESHLGPYPFRNEKLGIVEVPFVGMEHQTIIAMGLNYKLQYPEYNKTLFHEICHEWFGNMVTASDWNSFWIQESFDGYMELLYEEAIFGEEAYTSRLKRFRRFIKNKIPLAPQGTPNSREVYNGDSYSKGTFLLHSLRYMIGKDNLLQVIRQMAYPGNINDYKTDGTQCRFTSNEEFFEILEQISQRDFDSFEEVYFRNAELPILEITEHTAKVQFKWNTVNNIEFNIPLEIKTTDGVLKIDFENNLSELKIGKNDIIEIDPNNWVLMKVNWLNSDE